MNESASYGGSTKPTGSFFELAGEEVQRYVWASRFLENLDVLDVGCGHGYGSFFLAENVARKVVGIDTDSRALASASREYRLENLSFLLMNGSNMRFPPESFDAVVSFEVIEHLGDAAGYLNGIHRVLRPGGSFFLSTPNKKYTETSYIRGKSPNPYHKREFYPRELSELLGGAFRIEGIFYQIHMNEAGQEDRKITAYTRSCKIPPSVRSLFPSFLKNLWLRMMGFSPLSNTRGKWNEFRVVSVKSVDDLTEDVPVQLFWCKKN